jgi:hypothetical protein
MLAATWEELFRLSKASVADIGASSSEEGADKKQFSIEEKRSSSTFAFAVGKGGGGGEGEKGKVVPDNSSSSLQTSQNSSSSSENDNLEFNVPRPALIVDGMLGRLVRWLRVIGVDAESASSELQPQHMSRQASSSSSSSSYSSSTPNPIPSSASFIRNYHTSLIERANKEKRIILTRDKKLLQRKEPVLIKYIHSNETRSQFEEVCGKNNGFSIRVRPEDLMSRCSKCNGLGYIHMSSEEVTNALSLDPMAFDVPAKVLTKGLGLGC